MRRFPVQFGIARTDTLPQRRSGVRTLAQGFGSMAPIALVVFQHLVGLSMQVPTLPAEHQWLVHYGDLGADGELLVQFRYVLRIEPQTTMAAAHADAIGLVGAMNEIPRPSQPEHVGTQRVIRTRGHQRRQYLAVLGVFFAYRQGWTPCRVLHSRHDASTPLRRHPADPTDADGIGVDHLQFARLTLREPEQPHSSQIDDETIAWRIRQHETSRQQHPPAFPRQPGVDARVRANNFLVT